MIKLLSNVVRRGLAGDFSQFVKASSALVLVMMTGLAMAQPENAPQRCQTENIPATTPSEQFHVNGDGTVTDTRTGLMWMTCLVGLSGDLCAQGEALAMTWAKALRYAPELNASGGFAGYTDWRLANIRELSTLPELQCKSPAVNSEIFPGALSSHVWSSSPYHFYTHYSWYVDFSNGAPTYDERIRDKMVRLVREAQPHEK